MNARFALIASAILANPPIAFADEPALVPISEMAEGALTQSELLARCSGYYAAVAHYASKFQDEPSLLEKFTLGAGWRAAEITLMSVEPDEREATAQKIDTYAAAYLAVFRAQRPDNINDRTDPRNALSVLDRDICSDVMIAVGEELMGKE